VTRAFDKDGRLEKVTDWNSNVTKFTYDPDSDLATTLFPTESKDEDTYAYNDADQMSEVKMLKGAETLASLVYTRDNDGQVKGATSKGLPGEEKPAYEYDENNRLTKGAAVAYEYDSANNPTKIGTGAYKYNAADELETGPSLTYTYDELGERTKTKPTTGPATTYGYDQAGELTSVERPKEGETPEIKDTYAYNGEGLRASQTISGTTTYLTWDMTEGLPLILGDTTNSYIYGPDGLPVEQISSGGTVTYLHHDQQGSTRLLTGSTGTVTGKCTYSAYGTPTCEGATTTPLGYDGQYTSSDTGLIYLRARVYDPATAQFLTVDPLVGETGAPYNYAEDNPANLLDPTGMEGCGSIAVVSTLCNWGQESGVSNVAAGALDYLTLGMSTKLAGDVFGFNADCTSFGSGGTLLGVVIGAFDGEDELELAAEGADVGASNLSEQLMLEEAANAPGERIMEGKIGDPSYPEDQFAKMEYVHESLGGERTAVHYWENLASGSVSRRSDPQRHP
jgi:RHS repeat-associated protein